jgi:AT hook motif
MPRRTRPAAPAPAADDVFSDIDDLELDDDIDPDMADDLDDATDDDTETDFDDDAVADTDADDDVFEDESEPEPAPAPKKRGRPRKTATPTEPVVEPAADETPAPKKRGRPKKVVDESAEPAPVKTTPKKRGRPATKKVAASTAASNGKIEFGTKWLVDHLSDVTGVPMNGLGVRTALRHLARSGKFDRVIGEGGRYSFPGGENNPVVKLVVKHFTDPDPEPAVETAPKKRVAKKAAVVADEPAPTPARRKRAATAAKKAPTPVAKRAARKSTAAVENAKPPTRRGRPRKAAASE